MNLRVILIVCAAPFLLTACQMSQTASSSFAGQSLQGEPVKKPVELSYSNTQEQDAAQSAAEQVVKEPKAATGHTSPSTAKKKAEEAAVETKAGPGSSKRITVAEGRRKYRDLIAKHARAHGVPVKLAMAVVQIESSYRVNARGSRGEIGLMQLLPSTARFIGYKGPMKKLYHPETNIRYGMKYLGKAHRLGGGSLCGTILKYNAGHGAKRMNSVSRTYCNRVRKVMARS